VGHDSQEARVNTTPSTTYNPFGWRLAEIADSRTDALRRAELIESLIVVEAEELALGRRHLTVVHGRPGRLVDSEILDELYDTIFEIAGAAEWSRVRGTEDHVTVTLAGPHADELLLDVAEIAHRANPGWQVVERPFPNVE
jgi:hypothetical protein